jgi:hypothetical protein
VDILPPTPATVATAGKGLPLKMPPVSRTTTVGIAGAMRNVVLAVATVAGVGGRMSTSLEGVTPILTYYAGSTATGTPLSGAPSAAGTYTVVASFNGSADYGAASARITFTITKASAVLRVTDRGGTYNSQPFAATATVAGVVPFVDNTPAASLEGVRPTLTYYLLNSDGTRTRLAGAPSGAGRYEVDASFAGSADYAAASHSATFTITRATPSFSSLTSASVPKGTASTVVSGTIRLGSLIPTGQVTIMIDGTSVTAMIQADGSFSATLAIGSLGVGKHSITYFYAGDENFKSISEKGTLVVTPS